MGESRKEHIKKITSIGGSALIEGIMMRGPKKTMVAVRTGENEIYTQEVEFHSLAEKCKIFKIPLVIRIFENKTPVVHKVTAPYY